MPVIRSRPGQPTSQSVSQSPLAPWTRRLSIIGIDGYIIKDVREAWCQLRSCLLREGEGRSSGIRTRFKGEKGLLKESSQTSSIPYLLRTLYSIQNMSTNTNTA
ncbi:hypothetical protein BDBG_18002 [Blastomyces gilchristii SLH14081]|uniref:Uncharacterized protein n=1 Tax=Blastomyces gilchristii (strain SLH14081) TaxID=559298 RepID=A0A179V4K7_BLAGS|nr:uncharacterized protein BDBG_18002 [Blastomyces gilchristii SLH14081]OAT14357.1 hypothetical protein BDBG_18002 [Blastomyces gilchristii SLH14081]